MICYSQVVSDESSRNVVDLLVLRLFSAHDVLEKILVGRVVRRVRVGH